MNNLWKYIIIGVSVVLSAMVLAAAYTQNHRTTGTITVTGLGETEFTSDLIVINGMIKAEAYDAAEAYSILEDSRDKVIEFLKERGVNEERISFNMPSTYELSRSVYTDNGNYQGSVFAGYEIQQQYTIESDDVDITESAARELPSLIAVGIDIDVYNPMYYYTGLEDVKLSLLAAAAEDARDRAKNIAESSGSELGKLKLSRAGVFQITAATGDEEFSAGGSFNLSSREKKARVTVRSEFYIVNN